MDELDAAAALAGVEERLLGRAFAAAYAAGVETVGAGAGGGGGGMALHGLEGGVVHQVGGGGGRGRGQVVDGDFDGGTLGWMWLGIGIGHGWLPVFPSFLVDVCHLGRGVSGYNCIRIRPPFAWDFASLRNCSRGAIGN